MIALLSVPIMLLGKPLVITLREKWCSSKKHSARSSDEAPDAVLVHRNEGRGDEEEKKFGDDEKDDSDGMLCVFFSFYHPASINNLYVVPLPPPPPLIIDFVQLRVMAMIITRSAT